MKLQDKRIFWTLVVRWSMKLVHLMLILGMVVRSWCLPFSYDVVA